MFVQISESQIGRAIRTRTHTYAVVAPTRNPLAGHRQPSAGRYVESHLYDNAEDPAQQVNLVDDPATSELRSQLSAVLAARIGRIEGAEPRIDRH